MSSDTRRFPASITLRITKSDHDRLRKLAEGGPATSHGLARHLFVRGLDLIEKEQAAAPSSSPAHGQAASRSPRTEPRSK
jgi:hypothetical protein